MVIFRSNILQVLFIYVSKSAFFNSDYFDLVEPLAFFLLSRHNFYLRQQKPISFSFYDGSTIQGILWVQSLKA